MTKRSPRPEREEVAEVGRRSGSPRSARRASPRPRAAGHARSSTQLAREQVGADHGQRGAERERAGGGADHDVGGEQDQRPARACTARRTSGPHAGQPRMEERREATGRRGEEAVAERRGLPEVDRLVAVPRVRREEEVVRQRPPTAMAARPSERQRASRPGRSARAGRTRGAGRPPVEMYPPSSSQPTDGTATGIAAGEPPGTIPPRMTAAGTRGTRAARVRPAVRRRSRLVRPRVRAVPALVAGPARRATPSSTSTSTRALPRARAVALGPARRRGHRAPPADRLPVPDGAVLLARRPLGIPDWIAQRLWLGTISLAAALGARWLFRRLGLGPMAAFVARSSTCSPRTSSRSPPGSRCCSCRGPRSPGSSGSRCGRSTGRVARPGADRADHPDDRRRQRVVVLFVLVAPALWIVLELGRGGCGSAPRAAARAASRCSVGRVGLVDAGCTSRARRAARPAAHRERARVARRRRRATSSAASATGSSTATTGGRRSCSRPTT